MLPVHITAVRILSLHSGFDIGRDIANLGSVPWPSIQLCSLIVLQEVSGCLKVLAMCVATKAAWLI